MLIHDDIWYNISRYLSTSDILRLSYTRKDMYKKILNNNMIMMEHYFTVCKNVKNYKFLTKLPYKVLCIKLHKRKKKGSKYLVNPRSNLPVKIDCSKINKDFKYKDFKYLHNICCIDLSCRSIGFLSDNVFECFNQLVYLNISGQPTISDDSFKWFKNLKYLIMIDCNQENITDKGFKYLQGIKHLNISGCNQRTITDQAFEYLKGVTYLDMSGCNQIIVDNLLVKVLKISRIYNILK